MSRFESSKFVRNQAIMRQDCVRKACDKLGWKYTVKNNTLLITDIDAGVSFGSEYAIKIEGDDVIYNTYYLGNTADYVQRQQQEYNLLNVEYSKAVTVEAFKKHGFTYKENPTFTPNDTEVISFYMVGRSNLKDEDEPVGQIKFTILFDGTVISDSDYLPEDVNNRAHASMDAIDSNFSSSRIMTRKDIPARYRHKVMRDANMHVINIKH